MLFVNGLLGTATLGILTFVTFRLTAPSVGPLAILLLIGNCCFVYFSVSVKTWLPSLTGLLPKDRTETLGFAFVSVILGLYFFNTFHFQNHEDAYLYHLALADDWIREQQVGLIYTNIFSGYAQAVEHFYLFLKILFKGSSEQNAAAQMFHAMFGWGTFVVLLLELCSTYLTRVQRLYFILVCASSHIAFFMFLPKNDGFAAAIATLAIISWLRGYTALFLSAAAVAFAVKSTTSICFISIAASAFFVETWSKKERSKHVMQNFGLLMLAACAMLLLWLPFGLNNYLASGNPMFPVLNEVFKSPYAPTNLSDVVTEMRPFSLSIAGFFSSAWRLYTYQPAYLLATVASCFGVVFLGKQKFMGVLPKFSDFGVLALIYFIFLLTLLGPFMQVEPRHFMPVIGIFIVISLTTTIRILNKSTKQWVGTVIIAGLALSTSQADVRAKNFIKYLKQQNITGPLLQEKPVIAFNHFLTHQYPNEHPNVLALSTANTSFLLAKGEFWHRTKAYPLCNLSYADIKQAEWLSYLREHNITHLIYEDGRTMDKLRLPADQTVLEMEQKYFQLYRIKRESLPGAAD
jgi:hypothetical protein